MKIVFACVVAALLTVSCGDQSLLSPSASTSQCVTAGCVNGSTVSILD